MTAVTVSVLGCRKNSVLKHSLVDIITTKARVKIITPLPRCLQFIILVETIAGNTHISPKSGNIYRSYENPWTVLSISKRVDAGIKNNIIKDTNAFFKDPLKLWIVMIKANTTHPNKNRAIRGGIAKVP